MTRFEKQIELLKASDKKPYYKDGIIAHADEYIKEDDGTFDLKYFDTFARDCYKRSKELDYWVDNEILFSMIDRYMDKNYLTLKEVMNIMKNKEADPETYQEFVDFVSTEEDDNEDWGDNLWD